MDCMGPFCVTDRYGSSRLGKSQDWKAKAGESGPADWHEMIRDRSFGNPLIVGLKNDDDSLHAVAVGSNVSSWIALSFLVVGTAAFIVGFEVEERWKRVLRQRAAQMVGDP